MKKTGAQILIESLLKEGVEVVFGYPGGQMLPIYDALYNSPLKHILVRHEQGAAHMADGFSRATGRVGVCFATSGPGATNLVTGIANAYMDSIPMIAITGQVPTSMIGNDAFQEADITGITRSISKHNYLVKDVKDLAQTVKEAFYIASTGRPGPVLIDIPKDVQVAETEFNYPKEISMRSYNPTFQGHPGQIKKLADAIEKSQRPVIYAGGGVISSNACSELKKLVDITNIPVTTTLMGMGAFPADSELYMGMLGMHGTRTANYAVTESDLLISVGARFDDRVTGKISHFAQKATIAHIDIDPTSISKSVEVDIPLVGDAKKILSDLNKVVKKKNNAGPWIAKIKKWKKTHPLAYKSSKLIKPQFVIEEINRITKGEAIIATEVGQNQMWTAQFYKFNKPRTFLSSGGLGTMGYGFPAAIGAKVGCPSKIVFDIAGDGSFQMNLQQLATAVQYKIPVKVAILNNGCLGMVRQWQELFFAKRYSSTILENPDFVKIAEAYGALGIRISKPKDVAPAIEKAIASKLPAVLDFQVDCAENVFPMVPAGSPISEMLDGLA